MGAPPFYNDIWSYDANADEWTQIADFPSHNISGILFSSATKGYIGVNVDNVFDSCKVYEYDPATNAWREIQKFPSGSFLNTESFRLNDRLFVVGGMWSEFSKQVWEFIP